ncbi:MAG: molybdopterin-dependent oxidoreductase [Candidatus Tectomicrobia bacterium]|uniref:Molybdopterin-dependent oxidoreductase n=1 Tax=Tectimicrobiota bacterium TaxID=2528274 RepID=A0A932CPL8_UNCTE|nr:molybdopterin-dependent oxidoreductase [Candidatus Tectomicrobia bacterium]
MDGGIHRRDFLKFVAASGMAAACDMASQPPERLISSVLPPPEGIIPGVATWYATACRECPAGCGMLVRTREGRAVKAEGNPQHPINQGRLCAMGQASLQGLYNPDRIRQPWMRDRSGRLQPISWERAEQILARRIAALRKEGKAAGITFLTGHLPGSFDRFIDLWLGALGSTRRFVQEAFSHEALLEASRLAFGRPEVPHYVFEEARYLVNFGADFLGSWLSPVGHARAFGEMRRCREGGVGRFVHIEPRLSLTGANADQWIPIRPGTEGMMALGMAREVLALRAAALPADEVATLQAFLAAYDPESVSRRTEVPADTIRQLAREFAQAAPSLALGGGTALLSRSSTATLVAIHLLNYVAGNLGKTVRFGPAENVGRISPYRALRSLAAEMARGEVPLLLVHGANPVFTLPPSTGFPAALARVPFVVSFSSFPDETALRAHLVLPDHTGFEGWGDLESRTGVYSLMQPVMQPLFDTKATGDVLLSVARQVDPNLASPFRWASFPEYLQESWREIQQRMAPGEDVETFWEEALRRGGAWYEVAAEEVRLSPEALRIPFEEPTFSGAAPEGFYLIAYPSTLLFDGRGTNKPWLQEVSDPMTKVVWNAWVEIHPQAADRLGIAQGDLVAVTSPYGRIELPAYLSTGVRPDVVAIPIGQGHEAYGRYAAGRGASPLPLLPPEPEEPSGGFPWLSVRVTLARTGRRAPLVILQGSSRQFDRGFAQAIPLAELRALQGTRRRAEGVPSGAAPRPGLPSLPDIYEPHPHPEHRWGMAIDLQRCTGCAACMVACYAENNLPAVGEEECARGREMSWIFIERYHGETMIASREGMSAGQRPDPPTLPGGVQHPDVRFLPMLCQHCDNAPCEPVCPVYATYHNDEGLNIQIYNRCVGTRYCSNNCPYKVRRFNWFDSTWADPLPLQLNPDVSVRSAGVMEKCTFCIQRIRDAKDRAKDEERWVRDGEVAPACVQTCPTGALVFGDLKDPQSQVSQLRRDPRGYHVLFGLNTHSAITYLKKIQL